MHADWETSSTDIVEVGMGTGCPDKGVGRREKMLLAKSRAGGRCMLSNRMYESCRSGVLLFAW